MKQYKFDRNAWTEGTLHAGSVFAFYREDGILEGYGRLIEKYGKVLPTFNVDGVIYLPIRWKILWLTPEEIFKEGIKLGRSSRINVSFSAGQTCHRILDVYVMEDRREYKITNRPKDYKFDRFPSTKSSALDSFLKVDGKEIY